MLTPPGKPCVAIVTAVVPVVWPVVAPDARAVLSSVFEEARDVGAGVSLTESNTEGAGVAETDVMSGRIC